MEVLTTAEMEQADRLAIAGGTPGFALMLSAGQAVAEAAMELVGARGRSWSSPGRGNNGGDGFVAARRTGSARPRGRGHPAVRARQPEGRCRAGGARLEGAGAAVAIRRRSARRR